GVVGNNLFQVIRSMSADADRVGAIQAICLLVLTVGTLLYTLFKSRIPTHRVKNRAVCVTIGLVLGVMSSFLGIGGGPINLVVLFFFFSMDTKTAAENSLYIILFSQVASLLASLVTRTVPDFSLGMLCLMVGGGIAGGICGRNVNKKLESAAVDKLFIALMVLMIFINLYNIYRFHVV
ncbi:MAG: sulfite exporter TauE/SafE family protein, partial [Oscillibacter sp.]|nr:sulfite exporter TauE/SafE family protein [Oscillibacter sp.]